MKAKLKGVTMIKGVFKEKTYLEEVLRDKAKTLVGKSVTDGYEGKEIGKITKAEYTNKGIEIETDVEVVKLDDKMQFAPSIKYEDQLNFEFVNVAKVTNSLIPNSNVRILSVEDTYKGDVTPPVEPVPAQPVPPTEPPKPAELPKTPPVEPTPPVAPVVPVVPPVEPVQPPTEPKPVEPITPPIEPDKK